MRYKVQLTPEAKEDFSALEEHFQKKLNYDFKTIREVSINSVVVNNLGDKLFEIKTGKIRSLFEYRKGRLIIVAVIFLKKGQKTPPIYINRAKNILKKY